MSKKEGANPPKSANGDSGASQALDVESTEAVEMLQTLLNNQGGVTSGTTSDASSAAANTSQVGEAQQAAIEQMMQNLKLQGTLPNATETAAVAEEKKHAFWDTQVRERLYRLPCAPFITPRRLCFSSGVCAH